VLGLKIRKMKQLSKSKEKPKLPHNKSKNEQTKLQKAKPKSPAKKQSSPEKLINMANQYINSEDSLEKFQEAIHEKYKRLNDIKIQYASDVGENLKTRITAGKILNGVEEKQVRITKKEPIMKMPKNVETALNYYNMIES
jgi:hypothetical protein